MKHIVKRRGHTEPYDERKLYASLYAAALAAREQSTSAEIVAQEVVSWVGRWLTDKHEVTSNDIRRTAAKYLKTVDEDIAYQYLHHRVIW